MVFLLFITVASRLPLLALETKAELHIHGTKKKIKGYIGQCLYFLLSNNLRRGTEFSLYSVCGELS
jgi:hypothetical protein